ncbi:MAG TPA: hypothetical protein VLS90_18655, partial [Thermodesulfobacteriota bacterium]|nr:hypothetical protein [Thermodesulfobacteriota bacterium]
MQSESNNRDRKIVDIARNFLLTVSTFRELREKFVRESLRFPDLARLVDDRGESVLFALKENCHSLFRAGNGPVGEKEQIFDLSIGSLFHLAMKIR